ncbi:MAG: N-6 DNA methylase [Armatimonadota bacterium]
MPPAPGIQPIGQFFTHPAVAEFIADAVAIGPESRVLDPACGKGVFLRAAAARGCRDVWGVEADPALACAAEAQLRGLATIVCGDGLRCQDLHQSLAYDSFDAVIGNPPFSAGPGRVTDPAVLKRFQLGAGARKGVGRPVEVLFVEQFIRLARPGGRIGIILPEGILANGRHVPVRRYVLDHTEVIAVVALPRSAFRGTGTTARTVVLVAARRERASSQLSQPLMGDLSCLEGSSPEELTDALAHVLAEMKSSRIGKKSEQHAHHLVFGPELDLRQAPRHIPSVSPALVLDASHPRGEKVPWPSDRLSFSSKKQESVHERCGQATAPDEAASALLYRMDPGYWSPQFAPTLRSLFQCGFRLRPLGEFIEYITYGPIVTDETQQVTSFPSPSPQVLRVTQRQLLHTGLDLTTCLAVPENSPWDSPRARIRPGDLLIARSGEKGLRAGKMVLVGCLPQGVHAVVGCFVDLVRLRGIEPAAVLAFLKSAYGQTQIQRLTSGVGPPNISFRELRSVLVPVLPHTQQQACRLMWERVHSLHQAAICLPAGAHRAAALCDAGNAMDELVGFVEELIRGRKPA